MSKPGSLLGSNAPWPPATITVRERSSPRSVWSTTTRSSPSPSQEIVSAVVLRWTGTSNCSSDCSRSISTRSLASTRGCPGTSKIHFSGYSVVSWPPSSGSESITRERRLAHPGPERRAHSDRPGADHRDVDDLVEVGGELDRIRGHSGLGSVTVSAAPSSAPSARSTEQEMHVNVGVSRSV